MLIPVGTSNVAVNGPLMPFWPSDFPSEIWSGTTWKFVTVVGAETTSASTLPTAESDPTATLDVSDSRP